MQTLRGHLALRERVVSTPAKSGIKGSLRSRLKRKAQGGARLCERNPGSPMLGRRLARDAGFLIYSGPLLGLRSQSLAPPQALCSHALHALLRKPESVIANWRLETIFCGRSDLFSLALTHLVLGPFIVILSGESTRIRTNDGVRTY